MKRYRVKPGGKVTSREARRGRSTAAAPKGKKATEEVFAELNDRLEVLQEQLWAEHRHKVLVVLQGMDTSGKDGTIRHVFEGVNPLGVRVAAFKAPTAEELDHDFLWRVHPRVPGSGEMVIFNRSHYEDVLVGARPQAGARKRSGRRATSRSTTSSGCSPRPAPSSSSSSCTSTSDEQKKRLQERLDDPAQALEVPPGRPRGPRSLGRLHGAPTRTRSQKTSTEHAPWYVVPANKKWYRNLVVATVLVEALEKLDLRPPESGEDLSNVVIE